MRRQMTLQPPLTRNRSGARLRAGARAAPIASSLATARASASTCTGARDKRGFEPTDLAAKLSCIARSAFF